VASVLIAVAVIAGLCVLLSLLLIVADALLLDYGECTITINEEDERKVAGGNSLLATLMEEGIFIPSACGGRGSCGLCKVKVLDGGGPLLPTEAPHLTRQEIEDNVRLSCQVKIRGDVSISVPEEILSLQQYAAEVEKIVELNYDTRLIRLKMVDPPEFAFTAGQYLQLETPPYGKTPDPVYRAYSMASPPSSPGAVELIIRLVPNGICTTYVFELLAEGDPVKVNGPYGEFFLRDTDREILFIAGGSGIAPIRSMLHQMAEEGNARKATFYYGANELRDLYMVEEMRGFEDKLPNFTYVPVVARPDDVDSWKGETGLVTQAIDRNVADASRAEGYLCGSPAMIDAVVELLKGKGLPAERAYFDKFA
jgi:Na+-transporting NADH:ubiquinone oxidoreductase subunit F